MGVIADDGVERDTGVDTDVDEEIEETIGEDVEEDTTSDDVAEGKTEEDYVVGKQLVIQSLDYCSHSGSLTVTLVCRTPCISNHGDKSVVSDPVSYNRNRKYFSDQVRAGSGVKM